MGDDREVGSTPAEADQWNAVRVVRLTPDEWPTFRALRIVALSDAPEAFGSTLARERALAEADWRGRLERGPLFVARPAVPAGDGRADPVGMAGGLRIEEPDVAELVSMWVAAEWRGRGVGDRLVVTVLDWARALGCRTARLWVSDGNEPAERLYARHGFVPTGERQPIRPQEPDRTEHAMAIRLR